VLSSSSTIGKAEIENGLKQWKLVSNATAGQDVWYSDVCYQKRAGEGCLDLSSEIGGENEEDEEEGLEIALFFKDTTVARDYLSGLSASTQIVLSGQSETETASIVLNKLPAPGSVLGMSAGINLEDRHQHHSVLSLYPYSSLSIFTRTNGDVFTRSQEQQHVQQGRRSWGSGGRVSTSSPFPSSVKDVADAPTPFSSTSSLTAEGKEINPAKHIKFLAYAVRALVTRFWLLAKNADSADIFVVLLGYVLMHFTFVRLFLNMRKMGSSFWLRES
jgi:hypothetical protein